jgi:hypothetical protein
MSKSVAISAAVLLVVGLVGGWRILATAGGYPAGCPESGGSRLPLLAGPIVIGPSGNILSQSPHPTLLCPQFPGTLAVVPGTQITVVVSVLHLTDKAHVLVHARPYHIQVGGKPARVLQVVRMGQAQLQSAHLDLTVIAAYPVS